MKPLILIFLLACLMAAHVQSAAQAIPSGQVPPAVLKTFTEKFSTATEVVWELKEERYKAEFKLGTRSHDVWIDKTGSVVKHKEDFPKKELPAAVRQRIETDFKDYKIDDADKVEENGEVLYKIDLDGTADDRTLLITPQGQVKENKVEKK